MTILERGIADYDSVVEIGRGSFATVYQARQRSFDRLVAIKVLTPSGDPDTSERFEQECAALGRLSDHPGIVTVFDAGTGEDGRCYLVMELMTGGSLAGTLADVGRLDVARVLRIGVTLAGALESAHRSGVVHGDVKPENVLLSRFGDPMLADFGLARVRRRGEGANGKGGEASEVEAQAVAAALGGTLPYSAPELLAGEPPTPASDVYAAGATMHALLTGHPPFVRGSDSGVAAMTIRVAAERPEDLRKRGVPDPLCRILEQAMAKDPAGRQTMAQLGRQLQAVQARSGLSISPLVVEGDAPSALVVKPGATRKHRPQLSTWSRRVGLVLLAVGLLGLVLSRPGPESVRLSQVYQDDFEERRGWYTHDDELATIGYGIGQYRILVKKQGVQFLSDTAFRGGVYGKPLTGLGDVSVRVTAWSESGTGLFGVVCRQAPARASFYEGLVGVEGSVRLVKYAGGQLLTLAQTSMAVPAQGEALRIRLDCAGGAEATRLRLFVGGQQMADVVDDHGLAAGAAGLATATAEADSASVVFDDFVVLGRVSDTR